MPALMQRFHNTVMIADKGEAAHLAGRPRPGEDRLRE
jgi:hypothetical protein